MRGALRLVAGKRPPPMPAKDIFLPNWFIKLVQPGKEQPPNVVQFHCPQQMTKFDIKNYLEAIYKVEVEKVATINVLGRRTLQENRQYKKEKDFKKAYVYLKHETFKFPEIDWEDLSNPAAFFKDAQERLALEEELKTQGFE